MIRVLHVLGGLNLGGAETMVMNLYRAIDRTKIQFDFIIHLQQEQAYEKEVLSYGGKIYRFPAFNGKNILEERKLWKQFFSEHKEYKILHSHVRSYAAVYIPIAHEYGVKTIIHSHSTSNGKGMISLVKKIMQYPLRYQADYFFGCSKEAGQWLFGEKIVKNGNYHILKNAIDIKKYYLKSDIRVTYRKELNANDDTVVFVNIGRMHESKNHIFLLEVYKEIRKLIANSILVLVGEGELKGVIEKKIIDLDIRNSVRMLGARKDVPNLLQAADCFLFPSIWEGLPVTVVEAQAAGLPCFVSKTVTKEVNISELVTNLPIDQGTKPWVENICNSSLKRKDVTEEIKRAGFDIRSSTNWITDFYKELCK